MIAKQAGTTLALLNQGLGGVEQILAGEEGGQRQAFLPQAEKVAVYMTECITPEHFYVAKVGDVNSVQELERELGAWALEQGYPVYTFNPSVGQVVMVQPGEEEGEGWQRARVLARLGAKQVGSAAHCSPKGPYYRDRVPIGTFLTFWVPIGSLFIFQGPYFQSFGLHI